MKTTALTTCLAVATLCGALAGAPLQAGEQTPSDTRAKLSALSEQMSTCTAYYYLLASVVENSTGPEEKAELAQHIRSTGQALFTQAVNIASHIGISGDAAAERTKTALGEMVDTVNNDPANSLQVMDTRYGQPCDELLKSAPQRLAELLEQYKPSY